MPNLWRGDRASRFYLGFADCALAIAIAGFSTTYILPMATNAFRGPTIAHIHGGLFLAWLALLIRQTWLIARGRVRSHRRLGVVAVPLALAMAASGVGVGLYATRRDVVSFGDAGYSGLIGTLTAMLIFAAFVVAAVMMRNRPDWHKRLMVLATIAILWPAWFRFRHLLPWLLRPEITLAILAADSLILVAMLRDRWRFGKVHPAYLSFGTALFAEHVAEQLLYDAPAWRAAAKGLYEMLA